MPMVRVSITQQHHLTLQDLILKQVVPILLLHHHSVHSVVSHSVDSVLITSVDHLNGVLGDVEAWEDEVVVAAAATVEKNPTSTSTTNMRNHPTDLVKAHRIQNILRVKQEKVHHTLMEHMDIVAADMGDVEAGEVVGGWGAWGRGGHRGPPGGAFPGAGGFDLSALIESLSAHPIAQAFRNYAEQAAGNASGETADENDGENSFTPPIDVFSTPTAYILHVALPGAKKEDVGVNWDAEKGVLNLAGVVYRQGDEAFLKTLSQSERKVGVF